MAPIDSHSLTTYIADARPVVLTYRFVAPAWTSSEGLVDATPGRVTAGAHAVLAVGVSETGWTMIKNSWGPWWGDAGYGQVSPSYTEEYGVVAHVWGGAA